MTALSIKIAEAAVPDEIDLAPLMTDAFIKGGKERESLFVKQESAGIGSFGFTEGFLLFPLILKAISVSAHLLPQFISLDEQQIAQMYYIMGIHHFLGIVYKRQTKENVNHLPENYEKSFKSFYEAFSSELKSSELPKEQCDMIIVNVLNTLRKDPSVSLEFVERIAASK